MLEEGASRVRVTSSGYSRVDRIACAGSSSSFFEEVLVPAAAFIFSGGINGLLKQSQSRRKLRDGDPVLKSILPVKRKVEEAGPPLGGLQFDLATIARFLRTTCQVQIYEKALCLSDANAKVRDEILHLTRQLINSPRNTKIIYFSGHGKKPTGNLQLGNNLEVSFEEVFQMWKHRDRHDDVPGFDRTKEKLVVICDSCFSGQWVDRVMEKRANEDEDAKKMFVQASCQGDETSTDFEDGGMFTQVYTSAQALGFHSGRSSAGPCTEQEANTDEEVARLCGHRPHATVNRGSVTECVELSPGNTICLVEYYWMPIIRQLPPKESDESAPHAHAAEARAATEGIFSLCSSYLIAVFILLLSIFVGVYFIR